jgi:hypothetical protein
MASGLLSVVSGPEAGIHIRIPPEGLSLGRKQGGAAGFHRDASVSADHAEIRWSRDGALAIRDRGSTNGTYVNGRRISEWQMIDRGDIVTIGHSEIEVTALDSTPPPGGMGFYAPVTVTHGGVLAGVVEGGVNITYREDLSGLSWITETRGLARVLIILGTVLSLAGAASFGYPIIVSISSYSSSVAANNRCYDKYSTDQVSLRKCIERSDSGFDVTPWLPLGATLFFIGSVVTIAGVFSVPKRRE